MNKDNKFDVIHFANNPDDWERFKTRATGYKERIKRIIDFLEIHIKENFANFNPNEMFVKQCFINFSHKISNNGRWELKFDFNMEIQKEEIHKEFTFKSNEKNGVIDGYYEDNDFINFEGKSEQKYKDDFVEVFKFLNYYRGCSDSLISDTDIMVKILGKAKSNPGFKNIKHLNLYKNTYKKVAVEKNKAIEIMNENIVLHEKNEEYRKQQGFYNQYFDEWVAKTLNMKRGEISDFYNREFTNAHPELKDYPYEKFSANMRKTKSNDLKALRGLSRHSKV